MFQILSNQKQHFYLEIFKTKKMFVCCSKQPIQRIPGYTIFNNRRNPKPEIVLFSIIQLPFLQKSRNNILFDSLLSVLWAIFVRNQSIGLLSTENVICASLAGLSIEGNGNQ